MTGSGWKEIGLAAGLVILAAFVPLVTDGYWLSIAVTAMMYIALATAWTLFSGPTHYISLATGAFFGIGGYLVATGMSDYDISFWVMAAVAPFVAVVLAALVGAATLRLSGEFGGLRFEATGLSSPMSHAGAIVGLFSMMGWFCSCPLVSPSVCWIM